MDFNTVFEAAIKRIYPNGIEWDLVGILTRSSKVYTLSYDSKILSGIFEILCEPVIRMIAAEQGYIIHKAVQNQYPEFTLLNEENPGNKIAIDIKSTYRKRTTKGGVKTFSFTLGSYGSYLRDPSGKKGILYPYSDYSAHWVIGFLYDRNPNCQATEIKSIIEAANLETPYTDIEYFVQERYKIAGRAAGSGNTTNIGSIKSNNLDDFRQGKGSFSTKEEFEDYWKNY